MKILVIEAWGLHLGYLGCYGNSWVATPNLDRLAAEGIVFENHLVDQPDVRAETPWHHRSVATGCYVPPGLKTAGKFAVQPRVVRLEDLASFPDDALTLLESDAPWIWLEGPSLLPPWDFDSELLSIYFDEEDAADGLGPWPEPPLELAKLEEIDVLRLQNTYAAVVTAFDDQLGAFVDGLREADTLDDVLLCVTARTGLPLGEHGLIGAPRPWLHAELVHVPMLLRLPGAKESGLRVNALTQPIDLLPTFLETLGQPPPPMHGRSLWPLIRGELDLFRPQAISLMRVGKYETWLSRTVHAALHVPIAQPEGETRSPQLFLKPEDRWEVNDLIQQEFATAEAMEKTLRDSVLAIQTGSKEVESLK